MKLNLGCGNVLLDGYSNYDKYNHDALFIDLEKIPLPFKNNSVDEEILLLNVIEHLNINPYDFMLELYNIMKTGCLLKIELPVYACRVEHTRWFHTKAYFNTLINPNNINSSQGKQLFKKNKCFYKFMGFVKCFPYIRLHIYWDLEKK